ncbi:MAG: hypothetical protein ACJ77N_06980 [Chloroflexota bacterium]|jgi:hypothetical protein
MRAGFSRRATDDPLALGLLAYGAIGIVLLLVAAVLVAATFGAVDRLADAVGDPAVAARLDAGDRAVEDAAAAVTAFDGTIGKTADVTTSAETMMRRLSSTLRTLAASLQISVLGGQPFASVAAQFDEVATNAETVATDLGNAATSLAGNRTALTDLASELRNLRTQVAGLRADVGSGASGDLASELRLFGLSRLVIVTLLAWLAVPALAALVIGSRRLRARG